MPSLSGRTLALQSDRWTQFGSAQYPFLERIKNVGKEWRNRWSRKGDWNQETRQRNRIIEMSRSSSSSSKKGSEEGSEFWCVGGWVGLGFLRAGSELSVEVDHTAPLLKSCYATSRTWPSPPPLPFSRMSLLASHYPNSSSKINFQN